MFMMNASAVAFTTFAAAIVFFLTPRDDRKMTMAIAAVWILAAAIAFFLPQKSLVFVVLAIMLGVVGAMTPRGAVFLYLGVLGALPLDMTYAIPFPGINFLAYADYGKVATLVLLGPAFVRGLTEKVPPRLRTVDHLMLFFVVFTGVMSMRDLPLTSVMRIIVDQFFLIYIPYIAISRAIKTQKDVYWAVGSLMTGFMIAAAVGAISAVRSWNYYTHLGDTFSRKSFGDYRNGFLRVSATGGATFLAFVGGAALAYVWSLRSQKIYPRFFFYGAALMFVFTTFATGARGGWIGAVVCAGTFWAFFNLGTGLRRVLLAGMGAGIIVILFLVMSDSAVFEDRYGSVNYRADLLRISIAQIQDNPLFGSNTFLQSERFRELIQGEGIVDLVNAYLQVLLYYGFIGGFAFIGSYVLGYFGGLRTLSSLPPKAQCSPEQLRLRANVAFMLAALTGYLTIIGTISFTASNTQNFGYVLLAMMVAQVRAFAVDPVTENLAQGEEPTDPKSLEAEPVAVAQRPPGRVAYGSRFVRRV